MTATSAPRSAAVTRDTARRYGPFWLSLLAGMALWEIAGRRSDPAFMVPLSETLVRLWELSESGELWRQFASSVALFATGLALALAIGMPLGLLLARARRLRVAVEPYIMVLYATPMVALIPFFCPSWASALPPRCWLCFFLRSFRCSTIRSKARARSSRS